MDSLTYDERWEITSVLANYHSYDNNANILLKNQHGAWVLLRISLFVHILPEIITILILSLASSFAHSGLKLNINFW